MLKKLTSIMITLLILVSVTACGKTEEKVEEFDYSKIVYTEVKTEVTDEMILDRINELIDSSYKEIETDRTTVQDGDIINVTFSCFKDGVQTGETVENQLIYTFDKESYIPGFVDSCIGLELNTEKEFDIIFPEDSEHPLSGQTLTYKLTVVRISEAGKYEVNDELAKECGFSTLDELKEAIRIELGMTNATDNEFYTQYNALKAYVEYCSLEINENTINELYNTEIETLESNAELAGYTVEQLTTEAYGMTEAEYREYLKESCEAQTYYEAVTDDIIKRENLVITDELKTSGLERLVEGYSTDAETLKSSMDEEVLNESILRNEALHILLESATKN